jgi:hypothetical protein
MARKRVQIDMGWPHKVKVQTYNVPNGSMGSLQWWGEVEIEYGRYSRCVVFVDGTYHRTERVAEAVCNRWIASRKGERAIREEVASIQAEEVEGQYRSQLFHDRSQAIRRRNRRRKELLKKQLKIRPKTKKVGKVRERRVLLT